MTVALRLVLNLLLALLVSLFGSYIVLSSHRRPNTWLWGAVFGAAIALTMLKAVPIQPGWLFDFRTVVVALGGFAGGLPTYILSASLGSLYRVYLGGAGTVPGVSLLFICGLIGAYFGRCTRKVCVASLHQLLGLGVVLALVQIALVWLGAAVFHQGAVMTAPLALFLLSLTPLGLVVAFRTYSIVHRVLTEQATIEAAAASLPTTLAVLDAAGRVVATNKALPTTALGRIPRSLGEEPWLSEGRKYLVERKHIVLREVLRGELVTLDDVTGWHDAIEQLSNFFELALDLMVIVGSEGIVTHANRTAEELGFGPQVALLDIVHPEDRHAVTSALQSVRRNRGAVRPLEHRAILADDSVHWLAWSCATDDQGTKIYAVGRDITDYRRRMEELQITTAHLKEQSLFLELAYDAIIVRDLAGNVTFWNSGAHRTYGFTSAEAKGLSHHTLLRSSYAVPLPQVEAELALHEEWRGEAQRRHKNGTVVLVSCQQVLKRDENQMPFAVLEISRSITEQVHARQATAHLAALVEQSQDAIVSTDPTGRVLTANSAAALLLSCDRVGLLGESIFAFVPSEHRSALTQAFKETMAGYPSRQSTLAMRTATESLVPVSIVLSLIPSRRGASVGVSLIIRDLTDKHLHDKEIARLDRLNLASQLAAGIGHEVRNPITTIRGFLQLFCLRDDLISYREQFMLLIGEIDRMNETMTEFLTLARNHPVELAPTDITVVVLATIGLLEADARQAACVVECELEPVPHISASERAIRQVLVNLVRNALDASSPGGVVTVRTASVDGRVVLSVRDTGVGIPADVRAQIGTPFFTTKPEGTGLGLTVCQAIARQHGATLTFDSEEGVTTFYMSFPPAH